jgi:hypothetical protein
VTTLLLARIALAERQRSEFLSGITRSFKTQIGGTGESWTDKFVFATAWCRV